MSRRINRDNVKSVMNEENYKDLLSSILDDKYDLYMIFMRDVNFLIVEIIEGYRDNNFKKEKFYIYEKYATKFLKNLIKGNSDEDAKILKYFIEVMAKVNYNNNFELAFSETIKFLYEEFYLKNYL